MAEFLVYRTGRNRSNQPNADEVPVAAVEAKSAAEAIGLVSCLSYITIREGQCLSAVLRSEAPDEDWQTAAATEFIENVIMQHF